MSRIETREHAVVFIYQAGFKENQVFDEHFDKYVSLNDSLNDDLEYFKKVVSGVLNSKDEIDSKISGFLKNWTISRLPKLDVAVLEVAFYEILYCDDIPTSVSINEAVKLSKKYGTDNSQSYVNGVLSSFEKSL